MTLIYHGCVSGVSSLTEKRRIFPQCVPDFVTERPEHTRLTGYTGNWFSGERSDLVWECDIGGQGRREV